MESLFIFKLILSFLVGGGYAILATVCADKFGSKIGGLISGLPSTVLFGLFFIGWTQSTQASVEATTLIPAVIGVACFFLLAFVALVRKNIWYALSVAFILWFLLTSVLFVFHLSNFFISVFFYILSSLIAYIYVTRIRTINSAKGKKFTYSLRILLLRGFLTGFVVAVSVMAAKIGGPILGGVLTTFPAMFSSVLLINYFSHGADFSSAVAKSSLYAWISTTLYVIVARYTMIPFGIILGTVVSLVVCYISAYLLLMFVLKKQK